MINKKVIKIILFVLSICMVVSLIFATTYALFSNDDYGSNPNTFSTGTLSVEVVSKSEPISLQNALPMKDEEGVQTTPYIFTVRNTGSVDYLFDIKLLSTSDENNFSSSYIKLQVNDGEVNTLSQLTSSIIMSQVLLKAGETMDVSLRVWLDWNTPNSELGKSFDSEIVTTGNAMYMPPVDESIYENFVLNYMNLDKVGYTGVENENLVIPATFYDEKAGVWYKVTEIGSQAFMYASNIASVTIPDSVVKIGDSAFSYLNIDSINIPNSVTYIGDGAFSSMDNIESVSIPSSVTYFGDGAFAYCDSLTAINVDENNENYVSIDGIVYTKDTKTLVQYPAGMTNQTFSISNNVTRIGHSSFGGAVNLKNVTIPNSVVVIGEDAFYRSGLTSVVVPNSVTTIESAAFYRCSDLADITIPNSVTTIGDSAFDQTAWHISICTAGELVILGDNILYDDGNVSGDVIIPDNIKKINDYAFLGNVFLTSITIPNSVVSIGNNAFYGCDRLSNVFYKGSEAQWNIIPVGDSNEPLFNASITYNYY